MTHFKKQIRRDPLGFLCMLLFVLGLFGFVEGVLIYRFGPFGALIPLGVVAVIAIYIRAIVWLTPTPRR